MSTSRHARACRTGRAGLRAAASHQGSEPNREGSGWGADTERAANHTAGRERHRRPGMDAQIHGTALPVLEVTVNPGEKLVAEAGDMSWMSQSIEMLTTTQTAGA